MNSLSGVNRSVRQQRSDALRRRALGAMERRAWSEAGNAAVLAEMAALVHDPQRHGLLLLGAAGSGKTSIGYTFARSNSDVHVVLLAGTTDVRSHRFGVFLRFLDTLPEASATAAEEAIPLLAEAINVEAAGRPSMLFVDDIHRVDEASLAVIVHLLLSRRITLVATASDAGAVRNDLGWLISDGLIEERSLDPLNRNEARDLIHRSTGHPISEAAMGVLMRQNRSTPLGVQAIFREQVEQERIRLRGGRWIADNHLAITPHGPMGELVSSRLHHEPAGLRTAIERLALMHRTPWRVAESVIGLENLIELERKGYIRVGASDVRAVVISDYLLAETVRVQASSSARKSLLEDVRNLAGGRIDGLDDAELLSLGEWLVDLGAQMNLDLRIRLAANALDHGRPDTAVRALEGVASSEERSVEAQLLKARALYSVGRIKEAWSTVVGIRTTDLTQDSARQRDLHLAAAVIHTRLRFRLWISADTASADRLLSQLGSIADRTVHASLHGAELTARERHSLAAQEILHAQGHFRAIESDLERQWKGTGSLEFRLTSASMLSLCWAAGGREHDAVQLADEVTSQVSASSMIYKVPKPYVEARLLALLWSGHWERALGMVQDMLDHESAHGTCQSGVLELAKGLCLAAGGLLAEAEEVLSSALVQLESEQAAFYETFTLAALAYVYSYQGREEEVQDKIRTIALRPMPASWLESFFIQHLVFSARLGANDLDAARDLVALGQAEVAAGRITTGSVALFAANYYNNNREVEAVRSSSNQRQGESGRIAAEWASAVLERDPAQALAAAREAADLKLRRIEYRVATTALELAVNRGSQVLISQAKAHLGGDHIASISGGDNVGYGWHLTHRESQVARLAEQGLGNKEIADRIGISVRTVEGHLYQAFAKLGITSRQQLDDVPGIIGRNSQHHA